MEAHRDDASVQQRACEALNNLCYSYDVNSDRAGRAGAIEAAVAALRAHSCNTRVLEPACKALRSICRARKGLRTRARSQGALELLRVIAKCDKAHAAAQAAQRAFDKIRET
jgi:hypothetical protein